MSNVMTPSVVTDQQIDKISDVLRIAVRKHRDEFSVNAMQQALGAKGLAGELIGVVRKYVEMFAEMIIRLVEKVDRSRTPEQVLAATGRKQFIDSNVVTSMPRGVGEEAKIVFFKLGRFVSDEDLEKEFELRGLKPADPYSLAAVNKADPAFADEHPNASHWKDENGKWCYIAFLRWFDERAVGVDRIGSGWGGCWWFAGLAI